MNKKVLFVATVTSHINAFHIPYLKWFKEQGYEVHVASKGEQNIEYCDKHYNLPFERFPLKKDNFKCYKQLKKIIMENQYEIIHCHTPVGGVLTRLAARKARKKGTKVIYTAHGFHFYKGAPIKNWIIYYPIEKICARWTDCLITINEEDYLLAKRRFTNTNVEYAHGVGVDIGNFAEKSNQHEKDLLRKELNIKQNDFVLLYPAEISNRKNQMMLIEVMKKIKEDGKNAILLLAGKDSLKGMCQQKAKELGVQDEIKFLGYRNDISKLMSISNLGVSASKQEGLPVNIMEALASGLKVIATNCRGNRDLIVSEKNGYLVPINDIEKMSQAIENEIDKNTQNENSKLDEKYELDNVVQEYAKIYKKYESKTRVIHLLSSRNYSGAENIVTKIIEKASKNKNIEFIYVSPKGNIEKILKNKGIKYVPIKKMSIRELKRIFKEQKPNIIHAHDFKASVITAFSNIHVYKISHIHKNDPRMKNINIYSIIYLISCIKYNKILFVSESIDKEFVFEKFIRNKVTVIGNPIDTQEIINKAQEKTDKKYDVLYVGRLATEKNPFEYIGIIKEIYQKNKNIKCGIIGDGPLKKECIDLIEKYSLTGCIDILGFLENPYPIIKNAKIVCITSNWEGFGLVAIEALTLGVPVIARNVGGLKDIVDNTCGKLVQRKEEFIEEIKTLLEDEELRKEKSKKAIQKAKGLENMENYIENIIRIYGEKDE